MLVLAGGILLFGSVMFGVSEYEIINLWIWIGAFKNWLFRGRLSVWIMEVKEGNSLHYIDFRSQGLYMSLP